MKNDIELSILIPVKNRVELTKDCLSSLFESLPAGVGIEVLIQDNGSTDGTRVYLETLGNLVRVINGDAGMTFAQSNNAMAELANGRVLCLLNNDTVLLGGWIEPMLSMFDRGAEIGMVGNVQLFPGVSGSRLINHAGVVFDDRRLPCHLYEGMGEELGVALATREMPAVTGACAMILRATYLGFDGLDELYRNGHEDIDLCLRLRSSGMNNWIVGESRIIHLGSSTPGRLRHDDENTMLFVGRHHGEITASLLLITNADGVKWPCRSLWYRMARMMSRLPLFGWLLNAFVTTGVGTRFRQAVFHRLSRARR